MSKQLRVISLGFAFANKGVVQDSLETDRALFDFDVVVIRPPKFNVTKGQGAIYRQLRSLMVAKRKELETFLVQGGVLVVFLDIPDFYAYTYQLTHNFVNNYEFLDKRLAHCLTKGKGTQITYSNPAEPFVDVLKKSTIEWTTYLSSAPDAPP